MRQKAIRCSTLSSRMLPSVIGGPGGGFGAPKEPSDEEILKGLAWELQGDFKAAGVISFAIAYPANHVREMKVIATGEVTRTATKVVVVEEHGPGGSTRGYREIISSLGSKPILGALTIAGSAADSVYAWALAADEIAIAAE